MNRIYYIRSHNTFSLFMVPSCVQFWIVCNYNNFYFRKFYFCLIISVNSRALTLLIYRAKDLNIFLLQIVWKAGYADQYNVNYSLIHLLWLAIKKWQTTIHPVRHVNTMFLLCSVLEITPLPKKFHFIGRFFLWTFEIEAK